MSCPGVCLVDTCAVVQRYLGRCHVSVLFFVFFKFLSRVLRCNSRVIFCSVMGSFRANVVQKVLRFSGADVTWRPCRWWTVSTIEPALSIYLSVTCWYYASSVTWNTLQAKWWLQMLFSNYFISVDVEFKLLKLHVMPLCSCSIWRCSDPGHCYRGSLILSCVWSLC